MNAGPSILPRLIGATSLSKPGFDILLAASSARQASLPTVRMLQSQATLEMQRARAHAMTNILCGVAINGELTKVRPARFFDLPDEASGFSESMNDLFTRGFQPMLNPFDLKTTTSANSSPPDDETME